MSKEPSPPPQRSKVPLVLLSIFTVMVLLCCGGGLYIYSRLRVEQTADPAEIAEIRQAILEVELPAEFEAVQAAVFDLFIYKGQIASYERKNSDTQIAMMTMEVRYGQADLQDAQENLQSQGTYTKELQDAKVETRTYEIDGAKIPVIFTHGKMKPGEDVPQDRVGQETFMVQVMFPRESGMTVLFVIGPETEFDEVEIDTLLKSIHLPPADEKD